MDFIRKTCKKIRGTKSSVDWREQAAEYSKLCEFVTLYGNEAKQFKKNNFTLTYENKDLAGRIDCLLNKNLELVDKNQDLIGKTQDLIGKNQNLVGKNQDLVGKNQVLTDTNQYLVRNNEEFQSRVANLESDVEEVKKQCQTEVGVKQNRINYLDDEIKRLEYQVGQEQLRYEDVVKSVKQDHGDEMSDIKLKYEVERIVLEDYYEKALKAIEQTARRLEVERENERTVVLNRINEEVERANNENGRLSSVVKKLKQVCAVEQTVMRYGFDAKMKEYEVKLESLQQKYNGLLTERKMERIENENTLTKLLTEAREREADLTRKLEEKESELMAERTRWINRERLLKRKEEERMQQVLKASAMREEKIHLEARKMVGSLRKGFEEKERKLKTENTEQSMRLLRSAKEREDNLKKDLLLESKRQQDMEDQLSKAKVCIERLQEAMDDKVRYLDDCLTDSYDKQEAQKKENGRLLDVIDEERSKFRELKYDSHVEMFDSGQRYKKELKELTEMYDNEILMVTMQLEKESGLLKDAEAESDQKLEDMKSNFEEREGYLLDCLGEAQNSLIIERSNAQGETEHLLVVIDEEKMRYRGLINDHAIKLHEEELLHQQHVDKICQLHKERISELQMKEDALQTTILRFDALVEKARYIECRLGKFLLHNEGLQQQKDDILRQYDERHTLLQGRDHDIERKAGELFERENNIQSRERRSGEHEFDLERRRIQFEEQEFELNMRYGKIEKQENDLKCRWSEFEENKNELIKRFTVVQEQEEHLRRKCVEVEEKETELNKRSADCEERIQGLFQRCMQVGEQEDELKKRLTDLFEEEDALRVKYIQIEVEERELAIRLSGCAEKELELKQRNAIIVEEEDDLNEKCMQIEQQQNELKKLFAEMETQEAELAKRVAEVKRQEGEYLRRDAEFQQVKTTLEKRVADIERKEILVCKNEEELRGTEEAMAMTKEGLLEQERDIAKQEADIKKQQKDLQKREVAFSSGKLDFAKSKLDVKKLKEKLKLGEDVLSKRRHELDLEKEELDDLRDEINLQAEWVEKEKKNIKDKERELAKQPIDFKVRDDDDSPMGSDRVKELADELKQQEEHFIRREAFFQNTLVEMEGYKKREAKVAAREAELKEREEELNELIIQGQKEVAKIQVDMEEVHRIHTNLLKGKETWETKCTGVQNVHQSTAERHECSKHRQHNENAEPTDEEMDFNIPNDILMKYQVHPGPKPLHVGHNVLEQVYPGPHHRHMPSGPMMPHPHGPHYPGGPPDPNFPPPPTGVRPMRPPFPIPHPRCRGFRRLPPGPMFRPPIPPFHPSRRHNMPPEGHPTRKR